MFFSLPSFSFITRSCPEMDRALAKICRDLLGTASQAIISSFLAVVRGDVASINELTQAMRMNHDHVVAIMTMATQPFEVIKSSEQVQQFENKLDLEKGVINRVAATARRDLKAFTELMSAVRSDSVDTLAFFVAICQDDFDVFRSHASGLRIFSQGILSTASPRHADFIVFIFSP